MKRSERKKERNRGEGMEGKGIERKERRGKKE